MTTAKLNAIVQSMAGNRPFFYSEADFQHSLALALQANGYEVFLEYPVKIYNGIHNDTVHIDMIVKNVVGLFYPIELKYKTKAMTCPGFCGSQHQLRGHSAQDINRYLFWKDVDRLENLKNQYEGKICGGFVLILSNDEAYWQQPKLSNCIDRLFRIHPGLNVQAVDWKDTKDAPDYVTKQSRYNHFRLHNSYLVPEWQHYSNEKDIKTGKFHDFKYLTISV